MSTKLEQAIQESKKYAGAHRFFSAHPDLFANDANVNILASYILSQKLGELDDLAAWEKSYEANSTRLALEPTKYVAPEQPKEEPWPYRWCRPLRTLQDVRSYPRKEYTDQYFAKNRSTGELTPNAVIFRKLVQNILDGENARNAAAKFKEGENQ